jgi:hypothetical protein
LGSHEQTINKLDKIWLKNVVQQRGLIDIIVKMIGSPATPAVLVSSAFRFLQAWTLIDNDCIDDKYFEISFLEHSIKQLQLEEWRLKELNTNRVREHVEEIMKGALIFSFIDRHGNPSFHQKGVLLKNFDILGLAFKWLRYVINVNKELVHLDFISEMEDNMKIFQNILQTSIKDLVANILSLLENLMTFTPEIFVQELNLSNKRLPENETVVSLLVEVLCIDPEQTKISIAILKALAKILLIWQRGFELIDLDPNPTPASDVLISRCLNYFRSIDYTKIDQTDYLEIINWEEMLTVFAAFVSKSAVMKEKFVQSGFFNLYLDQLVQIIESAGPHLFFHEEDSTHRLINTNVRHNKTNTQNFLTNATKDSSSSRIQNKTKSRKDESGSVVSLNTKTVRLRNNIQSILEGNSNHLPSYVIILKYFFHPTGARMDSQENDRCSEAIRKRLGDLMLVLNYLWQDGQLHDVGLSDAGQDEVAASGDDQLAPQHDLPQAAVRPPRRQQEQPAQRHPQGALEVARANPGSASSSSTSSSSCTSSA